MRWMLTCPWPSGTSSPQVPGVRVFFASLTWTLRMSGARISTARSGSPIVVEKHVGGIEVHLQIRALQFVERQPQQVGRLLPGLEGDGDAFCLRERADLAQRVEERLAVGVARLGDEAGVQHQVAQPQRPRALQRPQEAFQAFRARGRDCRSRRSSGWFAAWCNPRRESRAWRRVMRKPGRPRRGRQTVALVPGGVMRVAAGDLHHVHAQPFQQAASVRGRS